MSESKYKRNLNIHWNGQNCNITIEIDKMCFFWCNINTDILNDKRYEYEENRLHENEGLYIIDFFINETLLLYDMTIISRIVYYS